MIFSLPFLIITFAVYGFIPELRNLHGKSLMCYVLSLTILYVSLSIVQLEGDVFMPESLPCISIGYVVYISVLLCFFWLNVMCFDIWSTFRYANFISQNSLRRLIFSEVFEVAAEIANDSCSTVFMLSAFPLFSLASFISSTLHFLMITMITSH